MTTTTTLTSIDSLALVADGESHTSLVCDGTGPLRRVVRQMYRVGGRVLVVDGRDEPAAVYRVWAVAVNVEDAADVDIYLIRQTKRGADFRNGLGMHDSAASIERFADDDTIRPESRAFWQRMAEVLAAARDALVPASPVPAQRYTVYDGGGAALCDGCEGRLDFSHRAVDNATGKRVSVCSTCATSVHLTPPAADEPVVVRPARRSSGYAIPVEPQDAPALTAGLLPLAGGDGFLF